jgi:hypothetical protein
MVDRANPVIRAIKLTPPRPRRCFYQWVMRRRLIYWYAKLKALEASFDVLFGRL